MFFCLFPELTASFVAFHHFHFQTQLEPGRNIKNVWFEFWWGRILTVFDAVCHFPNSWKLCISYLYGPHHHNFQAPHNEFILASTPLWSREASLISPVSQMGNWGTGRLSCLPQALQRVWGRARNWMQVSCVSVQSPKHKTILQEKGSSIQWLPSSPWSQGRFSSAVNMSIGRPY